MFNGHLVTTSFADERRDIPELIAEWNAMTHRIDSGDLLALNHQKLRLIQRFETIINQHVPLRLRPKPTDAKSNEALLQQMYWQIFYNLLLVFGLFQDAVGSYLFWNALFLLIPSLSNPVLMALSFAATALSSLLFYAFQVTFLKAAFDLPQDHTHLGLLLASYSSQLETTTAINQVLSSMWMIPVDDSVYDEYIELLTLLNQDLQHKHNHMSAYPDTTFKQILKASTLVFGVFASIANSYFTTNLLMGLIAAPLLGTPVGWAIVLLSIVTDLGYYYAMGATSIVQLIHPDFQHYQAFKDHLESFHATYQDHWIEIQSIKRCCFFKEQSKSDTPLSSTPLHRHEGVI